MDTYSCWKTILFASVVILHSFGFTDSVARHLWRRDPTPVPCVNGHFYRNPGRDASKSWTAHECSKYYLCLDKEVFEFRCTAGLFFDVERQVCDFRSNVFNCDQDAELTPPEPLLDKGNCSSPTYLACADGACFHRDLFCDGVPDCKDSSDEGHCDAEHDPNAATSCSPATCHLPDCFCSKDGTRIPGGMDPQDVPQMILLTFDDAVNHDNWAMYNRILLNTSRTNPNGCPLSATFYVSHEYTNYQLVQKLWNLGHEIAVHSISHRSPEHWWSANATLEDWYDEMVGMSHILHRFAGIPVEDIRGIRVPFLRVGWNRQFLMMAESGFSYDSSMTSPLSDPPLWPYTLDHRPPHPCMGVAQKCPSRSFPGVWEVVMNQLKGEGFSCAMVDSCPPTLTQEDIYQLFTSNLRRHKESNRAPLGLFFHSGWFRRKEHLAAFNKFLDDVAQMKDVWVVSSWQAIQWMQQPRPWNQLAHFEPWTCKKKVMDPVEEACNLPKACRLHSRALHGERFLYTCFECPQRYPWLKNELGMDML